MLDTSLYTPSKVPEEMSSRWKVDYMCVYSRPGTIAVNVNTGSCEGVELPPPARTYGSISQDHKNDRAQEIIEDPPH